MKTLIIIPSRLSATRLPGKPLLEINFETTIEIIIIRIVDDTVAETINESE